MESFDLFAAAAKTTLELKDGSLGALFLLKMRVTAGCWPVWEGTTCANETCNGLVPTVQQRDRGNGLDSDSLPFSRHF